MRWEGAVSGMRKAELLADASALIFPVTWPEPFGLVVVEALMSGTPVIATRIGSLPELVNDRVGRLLDVPTSSDAELHWVEQLRGLCSPGRTLPWQPEECRRWAELNFHYLKMAEGYETAYRRVIRGEYLHGRAPVALA